MDVLITGGAGFIGSHIVKHHLSRGDTVYLIDDLSTGSKNNLQDLIQHPRLNGIFQDLVTCPDLDKIIKKVDLIYHFAAVVGVYRVLKQPEKVLEVNIAGTQRLLNIMRETQSPARIIFASTSEVYGKGAKTLLSEEQNLSICTKEHHRMNYSVSKLADEAYALTYFEIYGVKSTVLRIFNVVGPKQSGHYGMVVPRFIKAALNHQPIIIYGTGRQKRSFCDVRDFVSLLVKLTENPKTIGEILNIGHYEEISILKLAQQVIKLTQSRSEIKYISYQEAYGEFFDDFQYRRPNLDKLKQFIDVSYQWDLELTLKDLIQRAKTIGN
jgi:UDP-glucose 4-epimerase